MTNQSSSPRWSERLIAKFGRAKLILRFSGGYELTGGTRNDRLEAREWTSFFAHEAAVSVEPDHSFFSFHQHALDNNPPAGRSRDHFAVR